MRDSTLLFFLSEARESLRESRSSAWTSVTAIAVCLLLLGSVVLMNDILTQSIERMAKSNQYVAYVDETLSEEEARSLYPAIMELDNVADASFTSREQAKTSFAAMLESETVSTLPSGIFRDRFSVSFKNAEGISDTLGELSKINGIAKISGANWVSDEIQKLQSGMELAVLCICVMVSVVSFVIVSNTVSATMQHRANEIYIMRLCGVSERHIKLPVLAESIILGLRALVLAFAAESGLFILFLALLRTKGLTEMFDIQPFGAYAVKLIEVYLAVSVCVSAAAVALGCRNRVKRGEKHA